MRAALLNGKHPTACESKLPFYSNMHIRSYFRRLLLCCIFTVTWVVLEMRRNNNANDFKIDYFAVFTVHQKTLLHAKFQRVKISFSYFIPVCMNSRDIVLIYILYLMDLSIGTVCPSMPLTNIWILSWSISIINLRKRRLDILNLNPRCYSILWPNRNEENNLRSSLRSPQKQQKPVF